MKNITVYDTHCDTASLLSDKISLVSNNLHFDLERAMRYSGYMQVFAVFSDPEYGNECRTKCMQVLAELKKQVARNADKIAICCNGDEVDMAIKSGRVAGMIALEGADLVQSTDDIQMLYDNGFRIITLTWNGSNKLASGIGDENDSGLTDFGQAALSLMNELGIIADVSHSSVKTFYDVIEHSKSPVMASHSNSKSICSHRRNLTDEQFCLLRDMGGYVGLNLYPDFLNDSQKASIDDILRHADRFLELGGENCIGLGADLDGVECLPEGIEGVQDFYKIADALEKHYNSMICEKILWGNFDAFMKKML